MASPALSVKHMSKTFAGTQALRDVDFEMAPGEIRAKGTVMNQPGFYAACDIKPGDPMYLAPGQRIIMW